MFRRSAIHSLALAATACMALVVVSSPAFAQADEIGGLIERWFSENEQCRGGSGDDPRTTEACARRDRLTRALNVLDFCYGKKGQISAERVWHSCETTSIRL